MATYAQLLETYRGFEELMDDVLCTNCEFAGLVVPGLSRCPKCKQQTLDWSDAHLEAEGRRTEGL